LPAEYAFIPEKEAAQVMELIGNPTGEHFLGLFTDSDVRLDWFVVARYAPEGYIKDDDAKDWDVDELLEGLQQGTEISNKFRKERGISEIEIVDWLDRPQYDERVHHLTYSVLIKEKEVAQGSDMTANWTTYLLGRKGYIDLTLVSGENEINDHKTYASAISSEFKFLEGKHYDDFNSNTDKVAAYGLAALIGGAAAKKLGLFAIIGVFLVKFAKVFIIAGLALAVGSFSFFKKFFRRE